MTADQDEYGNGQCASGRWLRLMAEMETEVLGTCPVCLQRPRESNGYCRECNNARQRALYRREVNPAPRKYVRRA